MSACATCTSPRRGDIESKGAEALRRRISWREAARRAEVTNHAGLKNHMERHYDDPEAGSLVALSADLEALRAENRRLRELVGRQRELLADQGALVEAQRLVIRAKAAQ